MKVADRAAKYDTSAPRLTVHLREQPVGAIGESGADVWFKYDPTLIAEDTGERLSARAVSVRLPVSAQPYGHLATLTYFDNLLLESDTRAELAQNSRRSNAGTAATSRDCLVAWERSAPAPSHSGQSMRRAHHWGSVRSVL